MKVESDQELQSSLQQQLQQYDIGEENLDDAILDYLSELLKDPNSWNDKASLTETVASFLDGKEEAAEAIVNALSTTRMEPKVNQTKEGPNADSLLKPYQAKHFNRITHQNENENYSSKEVESSPPSAKPSLKSKREQRKQRKIEKKQKKTRATQHGENATEDDSSAWQQCHDEGLAWGGRGRGGRGEYAGAVNSVKSNIHLTNVTVALPNGSELLTDATIDIERGRRYGLIGRNGVGKSILLKRLAERAIPGMPLDMRILLVQQQVMGSSENPVEVLLAADFERKRLLKEQEDLEAQLELAESLSTDELTKTAERLGNVAAELEAIDADRAEERAIEILQGLQFTKSMLDNPTDQLSGGWRMRLALARALFVQSDDLLVLDEVTNHMDLKGLDWLIHYLTNDDKRTTIVVSHDRHFLDAVCTNIMHLSHHKLKNHAGNFSEFERQREEKAAREAQILDASERKRSKAESFVQKQQSMAHKKSADPNKQRQAKMIRDKKLDRIGNYREDGKRYKLHALKAMSEEYIMLPQKVQVEVDDPVIGLKFPDPVWPPGIAENDPIITMDRFTFSYSDQAKRPLLQDTTIELHRGSKVALVGANGTGKSTVVKLIAQELNANDYYHRGSLWHHPNIRVGYIDQYSVENLEKFSHQTVLDYATQRFETAKAAKDIISKASGNVRQYLGAFGLGGKHALQLIGQLSGGERMGLCFATVMADAPQLMLLDESTNHIDYETSKAMSHALKEYKGTILMVSHNQGFLSGFCNELWVLEKGTITVNHRETESFDELFSAYRAAATGAKKSARG